MIEALYNELRSKVASLSGLEVFPVDYRGDLPSPPYLKVEFLVGSVTPEYFSDRVSGTVIFQGYFKAGYGQGRAFETFQALRETFNRLNVNNLSVTSSGMTPVPNNEEEAALTRYDFSFNFSYYGEP